MFIFVPSIPEQHVGFVQVGGVWMTPDEAEELAANLREAAIAARRGI